MKILRVNVGDIAEMKKAHPCSSRFFKVARVGSDIRVLCLGCGRDLTMPREKFESAVKKITNDSEVTIYAEKK